MLHRTPCTRQTAWALPYGIRQPRTALRRHVSTSPEAPEWFSQLRTEMLAREATLLNDHFTVPNEFRLTQTLFGFLPRQLCHLVNFKRPIVPFGHHLILFNPAVPTNELLPDGTDASHSPGGPWVRRMWAGGSVQVTPSVYYNESRGFAVGAQVAGMERIKDVQLRGQGDDAKIFVTIERRFKRLDQKWGALKRHHNAQMSTGQNWRDASLTEVRNLVFFKERTADELDALKAGNMAPVKYMRPPTETTFSHSLTPNRALLFRFSALTFNAHLIHLDPNYARNVEGHRNLLVHGPLSLMLMLQAMNGWLKQHTKGEHIVESIDYRNLAPLYCDEEMRICGLEKKTLQNGSTWDIWIEGPTGGMAVKGTVYTTRMPTASTNPELTAKKKVVEQETALSIDQPPSEHVQPSSTSSIPEPSGESAVKNSENPALDQSTSEGQQSIPPTSAPQPSTESEGENSQDSTLTEISPQLSSREVMAFLAQSSGRADRSRKAIRVKNYKFIVPSKTSPSIRSVEPYILGRPIMSTQSRHVLHRLLREPMPQATDNTTRLSTYRKYAASPHTPNPARTASRHSRFLREGVRRFERPSIRAVGPSRTVNRVHIKKWHH